MSAPHPKERNATRPARSAAFRLALLPIVSTALSVAPRASRADSIAAEALALFNEGVRLRKEGKVDKACALFAESYRLGPTAGGLLNIADCHEREGKLATAWAEFLSASRLYEARSSEGGVAECRRRASLLEPRLSRLTLRVERPVAGLVVKRDGRVVEAAQFGVPLPVDPGEYVIMAEAPGHAPFRTSVLVDAQKHDAVATVPALAAQPTSTPTRGKPAAGYIVGGLGVAALGVGATFGVMAAVNNAKAKSACPSIFQCSADEAMAARDRANTQAWAANVGVGLGLAGLGAGGYLLFIAPPSSKAGSGEGPHRGVSISPQPGGLRVDVSFLTRETRKMAATNPEGFCSSAHPRGYRIGTAGLCSLSVLVSCQILIGLDDSPIPPPCPEGSVRAGVVEPCVLVAGEGGASGQGDGGGAAGAGAGEAGGGGAGAEAPGEVIATGQVNVRQIAFDVPTHGTLFWVTAGTEENGYNDGKVLSCSADRCSDSLKVIASAQAKPEFVAVADENCPAESEATKYVYWTTSLGEVKYCKREGCGGDPTVVVAEKQAGAAGVRVTPPLPGSLDPAAVIVVWASADAGEIRSCPASGCLGDEPPRAIRAPAKPRHVISGNSFIYWLEEDAAADGWLYKLKKDGTQQPILQLGPLKPSTTFALADNQLFAVSRDATSIRWSRPSAVREDTQGPYVSGCKNVLTLDAYRRIGPEQARVYWNDDGDLWYCTLKAESPCAGAQLLLKGIGRSKSLLADEDYVYFPYEADGTLRRVPQPAW